MVEGRAAFLKNKKRIILALRFLFFTSLCVMILHRYNYRNLPWQFYVGGGAFLFTLIGLLFERECIIEKERISTWLFFFDFIIASILIYAIADKPLQFFIIYALAIFMAALARNIVYAFLNAVFLTSVYYIITVGETGLHMSSLQFLIRIPFLFVVTIMIGYISSERASGEISAFLENILQSIPGGVMAVDLNGIVTFFNQRAEEITSLKTGEVMGRNLFKMESFEPMAELVKEGKTGRKDLQFKNIPLGLNITPLRNLRNETTGTLLVFQDLTVIKKYESQLMQAEKMATIGMMTSGIAHEINNPLASVAGYAEAILRAIDRGEKEEIPRYAKIIYDEAHRCKRLLEDILTFVRPIKATTTVNVDELLKESVDFIKNKYTQTDITLSLSDDNFLVNGDPSQLKQVFLNLILNAVDAVNNDGKINIAVETSGDNARLEFRDNGCGIKREYLDEIFEPFFTTKPTGKGTGLGLSIVADIIRKHNGNITAASDGEGKGATFTITLPKVS